MKRKLRWLSGLVLILQTGLAQDTLTLKLEDALEATMQNISEVLQAKLEQESAVARFNQTNAMFLPQINLSYTAMATNNPLNAFGFKLQQQSITPSDFNPQLLNSPSATQNYMTRAEMNQPLLNLDQLYQRKALDKQVTIYSNKTRRKKEYLEFEVKKAYAQLNLSYQAVAVLKEALHTLTAIAETAGSYYEKGLLQKPDVLSIAVQLTTVKSKLAEAESNVGNASDYLCLLMGIKSRPLKISLEEAKIGPVDIPMAQVPENRSDLKALESALYAQEMMVNSGKMSYLPRLNAFATYMLNDKSALGFGSNAYLVGAQFSWNVFNGTALHYRISEQKIIHAKLEQELHHQKELAQLELNRTLRQLQDTRFTIEQFEVSVNNAAETLRILQDRFTQGLVSTNDVLQSQTNLSEQKLHQMETLFNYQITQAYLTFLTTTSTNQ